jgi:hypothetical protein
VVARVSHHHESAEDVHLSLEHLHGQAHFAVHLSFVNHLFSDHNFLENFIAHFFGHDPTSSVISFIVDLSDSSLGRHLL